MGPLRKVFLLDFCLIVDRITDMTEIMASKS